MSALPQFEPQQKTVTLKHGGFWGMLKKEFNFDMSLIPAGWFWQGSKEDDQFAEDAERPRHKVHFRRPYWMSSFPVTQELYSTIMGVNPSAHSGILHPVESVSWYDAIRFCNALSRQFGMEEAYNIGASIQDERSEEATIVEWDRQVRGFRLPTEAEWEFAARAMSKYRFAGSNKPSDVAWHKGNSTHGAHMVGLKRANDWGLYDMSGNILEWCWDWHGSYSESELNDPNGSTSGELKVARGGSWQDVPERLRLTARHARAPYLRSDKIGFRVVIAAS